MSSIRSTSLKTQPTEPSPEQTNIRNGSKCRNSRSPKPGPADTKSNTCAGFSICLKRRRNFTPWLSPDFEFTNTSNGEQVPPGLTTSQASSMPIECTDIGSITDRLATPSGHRCGTNGRQAVCTDSLHHRHRQSWSRNTEPHVFRHIRHDEATGRLPSIHWCGIMIACLDGLTKFLNILNALLHDMRKFVEAKPYPFCIFDDFSTNCC